MNEMTYNDWLEKELNIYKRENKLLNEKLHNLTTMFNEVHDNELETRDKKNDILKWAYSLEKENKRLIKKNNKCINTNIDLYNKKVELIEENKKLKEENEHENKIIVDYREQNIEMRNDIGKLKQQIEGLTSENFELQNDLFTQQLTEDEADDYIEKLKSDINYHFNLKMEYLLENQKLKQELFDIYKEK